MDLSFAFGFALIDRLWRELHVEHRRDVDGIMGQSWHNSPCESGLSELAWRTCGKQKPADVYSYNYGVADVVGVAEHLAFPGFVGPG